MDIFEKIIKSFPVRRSKREKAAFCGFALSESRALGYSAEVQTLGKRHNNIVVGSIEEAEVILCAHYDTPARSLVPNIMMPKNKLLHLCYAMLFPVFYAIAALIMAYALTELFSLNKYYTVFIYLALYFCIFYLAMLCFPNKNNYNDNTSGVATLFKIMESSRKNEVAFVFFDNEEKGLLGSKAFAKAHPVLNKKLIINLDCVGNGTDFVLAATSEAEKNGFYLKIKERLSQRSEFHFFTSRECAYNSDNKSFKTSVGICAVRKSKLVKFYTPRIHTPRDTVADICNMELLAFELSAAL